MPAFRRPSHRQRPRPPAPGNTTIVPRTGGEEPGSATDGLPVRLVALLTSDGQNIDQGLIWRIFESGGQTEGKAALVHTFHDASPVLKVKPGDYFVNVAFGRAHLTRRISVKAGPGEPTVEQFVINAGGLRVTAVVSGHEAPANTVTYSIYSDRDQSDNRKVVLNSAKPGLVIRLNAGIYHIISTYGDVNSKVASDVTVEAGKLTEVTLTHSAAKATFKLVHRAGGEALPDTQWSIQTQQGDEIKQSAGALPTHILAPGTYYGDREISRQGVRARIHAVGRRHVPGRSAHQIDHDRFGPMHSDRRAAYRARRELAAQTKSEA